MVMLKWFNFYYFDYFFEHAFVKAVICDFVVSFVERQITSRCELIETQ